jgi:hypothetical protein
MKTSIDIPDEIWRAAKHLAIESGKDLKDIVVEALKIYLEKVEKSKTGRAKSERPAKERGEQ